MRLIDADALKRHEQKIATQAWKMKIKASVETVLNQFIDDIDHAPTVDAVPVVRCYECKHFLDEEGVRYCELHYNMMEYDGFCSIGERKDGDHETD